MQQRLSGAIFEHRLPPGTKLPEAELGRIFGLSRGAVRKVLSRLAADQLVDLVPHRGAFVARPSVEETRDVYALRRILEAGVVRCLADPNRPPGRRWLQQVRQQIDEERQASEQGDTARYIRLAGQFHLDLVGATGNGALEQHLRRVISQTSLMTALYDVPGSNTCSFREHLDILRAIEDGDAERSERLMEAHLKGCERQLRLGEDPPRVDLAAVLSTPPGRRLPAGAAVSPLGDR